VNWISKASASQRAGRAGRTGPGHCYRLYSSALFEHYFAAFAEPEIMRVPIEGVILQMKSMHIDTVINFPFPSPPDRSALRRAEQTLTHLGALRPGDNSFEPDAQITELGRAMALFPLSPRFARMLVASRKHQCLCYSIAIVSALSVGDPFLREEALGGDEAELENEEFDVEVACTTGDDARAKEIRRLRRRAFFQSQHVRDPYCCKQIVCRPIISYTDLWANSLVTFCDCCLWLAAMSMLVAASSFARNTL
jgi:ATP-dependent RNA helicase DHX37/DHR1